MSDKKIQDFENKDPYPDLNCWRPTGRMRWLERDAGKEYIKILQQEFYNFSQPGTPENIWVTVPTVEE